MKSEQTHTAELFARMRRTPAFAFASAILHITPPADAPPSPAGGEWTSIAWFANVMRLRSGADISVGMWALALDDAGVELRTGRRGQLEARMSEVVVLDLIDHRATPADRAIDARFAVFGEHAEGALQ